MFHPAVSSSPPSQNRPQNGTLHAFSSVCSFSITLHVKTQLLWPVLHEKFLDDAFPGQNKSLNSFWVMAVFVCLACAVYVTVIFLSIFYSHEHFCEDIKLCFIHGRVFPKPVPNTMPYMQQVFNKYLWVNGFLNVFRHKIRATSRYAAVAAAKSLQSCPTLCNPIDGSPPGSPVPGILQARTLEWVSIPSSMHACMLSCFSCVQLCATPWTAAHQAPLSTGFSRQEYLSGLPFPSPQIC